MTTRNSTGLVNKLLVTGSFKATMALGFIRIYSGSQPSSADAAPTGTLLCILYSNGTSAGLSLETAAVAGVLTKETTETWSGTILADGTAGWYRFHAVGDTGALSTTEARQDGAIATSGAQMNLSTLALKAGATLTVGDDDAAFTLPTE
jgi:hypothetical protein